MVQKNEQYDTLRCLGFVCDLTQDQLTDHIEPNSLDLISALFVFSAIPPEKMEFALKNMYQVLKPGGRVLFRDYGIYDEAQIKFSKSCDKRLEENFYVRQDGTMSYFFSTEDLKSRFEAVGFSTIECNYVYRETTNRQKEMRIDRIFAQAKFEKNE
ncbi:S-adenosyl-L-methionine-dependent methyltransferase [Sporodiniella umbellata]|nr:S-adenosyl-L-methionine-dependent methyltransferase [Sporodiniella umbellata]